MGVPANGAIEPSSVKVRKGITTLKEGDDYILDHEWGSLGLGQESCVTAEDLVTVDYSFSLLRIDSVIRNSNGQEILRKGASNLTVPLPPFLGTEEERIANIFVPYHSDGKDIKVFRVLETPEQAVTYTTPGRLPKTMSKIKSGEPVKVVCWGDSVTVGGDASEPDKRYAVVFEQRLKEKFPDAHIEVETVAVGGSNSRQWLYPDRFPRGDKQCRWEYIANAKPDLVTLEFVNDAGLTQENLDIVYTDIMERVKSLGAEIIFILPHFTMMEMMGFKTLREKDHRPYVEALRNFAEKHSYAIADASSRWEHLWKEGIPYITLLRNGINHPDDRGHELFADELIKCFDG